MPVDLDLCMPPTNRPLLAVPVLHPQQWDNKQALLAKLAESAALTQEAAAPASGATPPVKVDASVPFGTANNIVANAHRLWYLTAANSFASTGADASRKRFTVVNPAGSGASVVVGYGSAPPVGDFPKLVTLAPGETLVADDYRGSYYVYPLTLAALPVVVETLA